ncbi:hypothetical protein ACFVAV_31235 [Nocardia sp. NPDC057663]|uniref:hypothetical protein n=1 Tax=Nocardia sp. NPDC057663 TaxID=3346201 RepID=UPI00366B40F9
MFGLGVLDTAALSLDSPDGRPREVRRAQQLAVWQAIYCTGVAVAMIPAAALLPSDSVLLRYVGFAYVTAAAALVLALLTLAFTARSRYAHALGWYAAALVILAGAFGVLTLPAVVVSVAVIVLLDRPASKAWFEVDESPEPLAFRERVTRIPAWARPVAGPIGAGWKALLAER